MSELGGADDPPPPPPDLSSNDTPAPSDAAQGEGRETASPTMNRAADHSAEYDPLGDLDPADEVPDNHAEEVAEGADTGGTDADVVATDGASTDEDGTHERNTDSTPDADSSPDEADEGSGAPPAETGRFDPMGELSEPEDLDEADPVSDEATSTEVDPATVETALMATGTAPDEEPFDPVAELAMDESDPDPPEADPPVDPDADPPEAQAPAELVTDVSTARETPAAETWETPAETEQVESASEETGEEFADGATAVADQLGESGGEVRTFGSNQEGAEYGRQNWSEAHGQLTDDQRAALHGYTCEKEPGDSGPPDYSDINGALRGYAPMTEEVRQAVGNLDQALELQPVPEDVMVVRETGWDSFAGDIDDLVGSVQQDPGYLSTALGNEPTFDKNAEVVLHLEVPAGTPAMYLAGLSEYSSERELLLGRGQKYEVTNVRDEEDGRFHVYGRIITGR